MFISIFIKHTSSLQPLKLNRYWEHFNKYRSVFGGWDTSSCNDAQQTSASITTFKLITDFLTIYQYLSHFAGITVKLQKCALDIVKAYEQIKEVSKMFKDEQKNNDSDFG